MNHPEPDTASGLDLVAIGQRVKQLLADLGVDQHTFADAIGVPYSTVRAYIAGGRPPSAEFLVGAFRTYGASPIWVLTGNGNARGQAASTPALGKSLENDYVVIPPLPAPATTETTRGPHYDGDGLCFSRSWLSGRGLDPAHLNVLMVRGGSMEGVLSTGDRVLIDARDVTPRSGYMYVLHQGDELLVKYCQLLPGGTLRVSSHNPAFQPYDVDLSRSPDVNIVGRVVASTRDW